MKDIILLGIGGHAHSVVDSIERSGEYHIVGFLDTSENQNKEYRGYRVLGTDSLLKTYYQKGVRNAFVTVGYMGESKIRDKLYNLLKEIGYSIPNIIDLSAIVADDVVMGEGNFIGKRAVINANVKLDSMCIVNTGAIIEHDCFVGNSTHVAVGAVICGQVKIGNHTLIGANSVVRQNVTIGNHVIIGAGTIVVKDVTSNVKKYSNIETYFEG